MSLFFTGKPSSTGLKRNIFKNNPFADAIKQLIKLGHINE